MPDRFTETEPATAPRIQPTPNSQPAPDPYDPGPLALGYDDTVQAAPRELTTIPVKKPRQDAFIRTHAELRLSTKIIERDGDMYLVKPALWDDLADEVSDRLLVLYVTLTGSVGLWPLRLGENSWNDSALSGARSAIDKWVRIRTNRTGGCYEIFVAQGDDHGEPAWPDLTMRDVLALAFKGDKYVGTLEHLVVRQLRGLAK